MIKAKTDKEKQNLLKAKIISKVGYKVFLEDEEDMEKIQSDVANELHEEADVELEQANSVVRLVIAEFIKDRVA